MADAPRLPPKKDVLLALLHGPSVYVHLDPRRPGVVVPAWFKKQPQLVLQVGTNLAVPIPDLSIDEAGVSCTLSFNRAPFFCRMPWTAVYALVGEDGRALIWPEDVPPELAVQPKRPPPKAVAPKPKRSRKKGRADAADVVEEPVAPAPADAPRPKPVAAGAEPRPEPTAKGRPLPPYLRVIK
jgi:hypothetical protein